MNKEELVKDMAKRVEGGTQGQAEKYLNAYIASISDAMYRREKVSLVGFGNYEVRDRAVRNGRNPQTKEAISIPACKMPVFVVSKVLKARANS